MLLEDECHVLWGDACGMVWGKRNRPIEVFMTNEQDRETYYGAIHRFTHEVRLKACPAGQGECPVAYLHWLGECHPGQRIIRLWEGASYQRDSQLRACLAQLNAGLDEQDWQVLCLPFAPHAPDQNPVEDIWLQEKNYLRKHVAQNKTFAAVTTCFFHFLDHFRFDWAKFAWYCPDPQPI